VSTTRVGERRDQALKQRGGDGGAPQVEVVAGIQTSKEDGLVS
jgi:hypothetical protein